MTTRSERMAEMIERHRGGEVDAHYLAYFDCFNRQLFFEAHEVLEELWLGRRAGPDGAFYKGLIQLAGAFVHLQKGRPRPAAALFRLAAGNLGRYPGIHQRLEVDGVLELIRECLAELNRGEPGRNPLNEGRTPRLTLT